MKFAIALAARGITGTVAGGAGYVVGTDLNREILAVARAVASGIDGHTTSLHRMREVRPFPAQ
jgi:hypothetical protein